MKSKFLKSKKSSGGSKRAKTSKSVKTIAKNKVKRNVRKEGSKNKQPKGSLKNRKSLNGNVKANFRNTVKEDINDDPTNDLKKKKSAKSNRDLRAKKDRDSKDVKKTIASASKKIKKDDATKSKGNKTSKTTAGNVVKKKSKMEEKKRLNRLYSTLLLDHKNPTSSKKAIESLLKDLTNNYSMISKKKNVSRILQACLKYGDIETRKLIFERAKENFSVLNLNAHSSKFFIKLYHYCNLDVKKFLKEAFFNDKSKNLLFSRYGADVMDIIYINSRSNEQMMILKLYAISNQFLLDHDLTRQLSSCNSISQFINFINSSGAKESCREKLWSVVLKLVEKELCITSLSHDLLFVYLHLVEDKGELISQIYNIFGQLLSTRNGNAVMCKLYGYATPKIRKSIMKTLKTHFPDAIYNQLNVHFLIRVLNCTDDTKISTQCLIRPHDENLEKIVKHKFAHRLVYSILNPQEPVDTPTSLKDVKTREHELQSAILPNLVQLFMELELYEIIEDKFANNILLYTIKLSKDEPLVNRVIDLFKKDVEDGTNNMHITKFVQTLIKVNNKISGELVQFGIHKRVWAIIKGRTDDLLGTKGVFLIVDLFEALIKFNNLDLIKEVKSAITIDKIKRTKNMLEEKGEKTTGLDIITKLLTS